MMRSLFSGVSGIKVHQTRMDVIGNNIANINTIGFKGSRTTFSDMLSQLQSAASAPTESRGGVNPRQVGLGVNVESIDLIFSDSSPQSTGKNTDLALAGNGLFYLRDGNESFFTRNGAFLFDESGYYVMSGTGLRVQGWNATDEGIINNNGATTDILVPVGKTMEASETTQINYSGNLNKESKMIKSVSYTAATNEGADETKVVTRDADGNITSVNVDGENVVAATITYRDDTKLTVTSGYYEVGKSVPITTLATIYDSLGGKHEVTILIDKDPNSSADPTDSDALATGRETGTTYTYTDASGNTQTVDADSVTQGTTTYTYTDASGNTQTVDAASVTQETENTYTYTDASGTTQTITEGTDGFDADALTYTATYTVTANEDGTYSYTDESGTVQNLAADAEGLDTEALTYTTIYTVTSTPGETTNVYTATYTVTANDDGTYSYTDESGNTQTVAADAEGLNAEALTYTATYPVTVEESTTPTYTATYTVTANDDGTYSYTDESGNTQTVAADAEGLNTEALTYTANYNVTSTPTMVYDNRWRAYIAPGVGEAGPAAGDSFSNSYTRSEATGNAEIDGSTTVGTMNMISYLYFNDRGAFVSNGQEENASIVFEYSDGNGAASNQAVMDFSGLTQYANSTTSFPTTNGNTAGVLQSIAVDGTGIISGTYTNGLIRNEAQIAVAQFTNSAGLVKVGTTIYQESNNSGTANIRTVADFGLDVISSALEMSNVDLATEFSEMIITQRGFQANSKMTTVSDEMLETLINMKR